jgi:hypothetical protein
MHGLLPCADMSSSGNSGTFSLWQVEQAEVSGTVFTLIGQLLGLGISGPTCYQRI